MAGQFDGKVALVTGAGSGIGRATALAFAREGATVVVADIADEGGAGTVRMIESAGGRSDFIHADISKGNEVQALVDECVRKHGRLDCAHNNAGVLGAMSSTVDISEEDWDRTIAINLKGVWLCMRSEIPQMLQQGGGAIVNTSSVAGLVAFQGLPAYVASKHGVAGLTKTAALENARKGIRVNAVCPGFIDTPLTEGLTAADFGDLIPAARLGTPEEVAQAVVWLCSDAASYVTGHTMVLDGAMIAQ